MPTTAPSTSATHPRGRQHSGPLSTSENTTSSGPDPALHPSRPPRQPTRSPWSWPRFARNAALLALLLGGAVWLIVQSAVPNLIPKRFGVVAPGRVYRAGELTPAALARVVRDHNIKTIIDFREDDPALPFMRREDAAARALSVRRVVLPLHGDGTGDPAQYLHALRLLTDPAAQPVLMHCSAGAQRTGCAAALYRTIVEHADPDAALAEARQYGHNPADNPRMPAMFHQWRDPIARALADGTDLPATSPAPAPAPAPSPAP